MDKRGRNRGRITFPVAILLPYYRTNEVKMWEKIKEISAGVFLIVSLSWILFHLVWIKIYGKVAIKEDNEWILKAEIVWTSLLLLLGLERLVRDITRNK